MAQAIGAYGIGPDPVTRPQARPVQPSVYSPPILTFGGAPEVAYPATSQPISYGTAAKAAPSIWASTQDFLAGMSFGLPAASKAPAVSPQQAYGQYQDTMLQGGMVTQTISGKVDGTTGFITNLRDSLQGILGNIGSTGDAQPVVVPASYSPNSDGGINWMMVGGIAVVAGVIYFASNASGSPRRGR